MPKKSAGILMYRRTGETIEVLLVHPGGPLWAKKDAGAWSIPKGEIEEGEDPLSVARREFHEETGCAVEGDMIPLPDVTQRGGKVVSTWAVEGNCDADAIRSNTFSMEWPPKSGRTAEFPEVDRAGWFAPDESRVKLNAAQVSAVDALCDYLGLSAAFRGPRLDP